MYGLLLDSKLEEKKINRQALTWHWQALEISLLRVYDSSFTYLELSIFRYTSLVKQKNDTSTTYNLGCCSRKNFNLEIKSPSLVGDDDYNSNQVWIINR